MSAQPVGDVLLEVLEDGGLLDALADRLARRLAERMAEQRLADTDRWLTSREAAAHLGLTVDALHKLTAARAIPFSQDRPGGKCWFKRADLNQWRQP